MDAETHVNRKKDDSGVATRVDYGVALPSRWLKSQCNPKTGITRQALKDYCLASKVNTLNGWGEVGLHLSTPQRQQAVQLQDRYLAQPAARMLIKGPRFCSRG